MDQDATDYYYYILLDIESSLYLCAMTKLVASCIDHFENRRRTGGLGVRCVAFLIQLPGFGAAKLPAGCYGQVGRMKSWKRLIASWIECHLESTE